jgi:hypothetical protein
MKYQVISMSWSKDVPMGEKRTVVPFANGLDMLSACRQYAYEHGYKLLAERADGYVALYWNEVGRLVRLAIEKAD